MFGSNAFFTTQEGDCKILTFRYHINLLKLYHRRKDNGNSDEPEICSLAVVEQQCKDESKESVTLEVHKKEGIKDINFGVNLTKRQMKDMRKVLEEKKELFSDNPGKTDVVEHKIEVTNNAHIVYVNHTLFHLKQGKN